MFLAFDLAMPPVSCHACGHVFCHAHSCCADTAGVDRGKKASDYVIASNSVVTELRGPELTGFDGVHRAIYAKVVAETTRPSPLESATWPSEEHVAGARDVVQSSAQPRASTPGQVPQPEDGEEELDHQADDGEAPHHPLLPEVEEGGLCVAMLEPTTPKRCE